MTEKIKIPIALFDNIDYVNEHSVPVEYTMPFAVAEYQHALSFLQSYNGSQATFNAYRREVERLLQWSWLVANKSILVLRRVDIEEYMRFCKQPPVSWISTQKVPRFIVQNGQRCPNNKWRPFVATVSKTAKRQGKEASVKNYELSQIALEEIFAILSSFYKFLVQEEITDVNPIQLIRQKSKFLRKRQGKRPIRRLSPEQWQMVIGIVENMAIQDPDKHERTLFIMTALYAMYLRISELVASERWTPQMCDFQRDQDGHWWFTTVGKGNKERQIAVSDAMLGALKRYRQHLGLPLLPTPADTLCLLTKHRGKGAITDTSYVRKIVQLCFDKAILRLTEQNMQEEAQSLQSATVHWLRHTGISDDVKHRPREHVRDDAGHSSSAITDRYIDIEMQERHRSARDKLVKQD
jgi:site-specific recombinase XerD